MSKLKWDIYQSLSNFTCRIIVISFDLSIQSHFFFRLTKNWMAHANFLKESNERDMGNYRLISALLCFSKMLEKMRQNRVYKRLNENDLGCIK